MSLETLIPADDIPKPETKESRSTFHEKRTNEILDQFSEWIRYEDSLEWKKEEDKYPSLDNTPLPRDAISTLNVLIDGSVGLPFEEIVNRLSDFSAQNPKLYERFVKFLRVDTQAKERDFLRKVEKLTQNYNPDSANKERLTELAQITYNLESLPEDARTRLRKDFPSGNFLVHTTHTINSMAILASGSIKSSYEIEKLRRSQGLPWSSHGGTLGIAANFNEMWVLAGDKRHFVSFVAAPEVLLDHGYQLGVPAFGARNELQIFPNNLDVEHYNTLIEEYTALSSFLYRIIDPLDPNNFDQYVEVQSVYAIDHLQSKLNEFDQRNFENDRILNNVLDSFKPIIGSIDREYYSEEKWTTDDKASAELAKNIVKEELGEAGEALLERLKKKTEEIAKSDKVILLKTLMAAYKKVLEELGTINHQVEAGLPGISIEEGWIMVSSADLPYIQKTLAQFNVKPKGILVYSQSTGPRIPNWLELHGDHKVLEKALTMALKDSGIPESRLDWESLLPVDIKDALYQSYGNGNYRILPGLAQKCQVIKSKDQLQS